MTFARLRRADWVVLFAALALLFVMASDWYSTKLGEEARRIERIEDPQGALGGEPARQVEEDARFTAEREEENAWQASAVIDRVILVVLLATVGLSIAAAFLRAAGRRFEPPLTPTALAAVAGAIAALLVGYRLLQQPGLDAGTTVKAGVPLALAVLGVLVLFASRAVRDEERGTAFREPPARADAPGGDTSQEGAAAP